jgi:hypothetical protein
VGLVVLLLTVRNLLMLVLAGFAWWQGVRALGEESPRTSR